MPTTYTYSGVAQFRDQNPTAQAGGAATGPAANASLTTATLPNGNAIYEVSVFAFLSGTVTAADASNMVLKQGSTVLMTLPVVQAVASGIVPVVVVVNSAAGTAINVSVGAGTPGGSCGYNAAVVARQVG
jgi:hypothetical protein